MVGRRRQARPTHGHAILTGHVNYAGVTGVLATINKLDPGDTVYISGHRRGARVRLAFRVTGVRTYHETALPYRQIVDQQSVGRIA